MRLLALALLLPALLPAQTNKVFYYPKPVARTAYQPPMKPVIRLADLKAKHQGKTSWHERVVHDENSLAVMIQEPPGAKYERRLYSNSPAWWAVVEGRIRFEIEKPSGGFEVFEASKGSYVFAPERLLHSLEVIGNQPAIRLEVTLASVTPVYQKPPSVAPPGIEYLPVRLDTGVNPSDVPDPDGRPWPYHVNIHKLVEQNKDRPNNWSHSLIRKNRARSNVHCGPAIADQPLAGNRGHFHSDYAEFWVVMLGELRWVFEGDVKNAVLAREGDIVYAPPKTFHLPQFWGKEGLNCRLTNSAFPGSNHLYDTH